MDGYTYILLGIRSKGWLELSRGTVLAPVGLRAMGSAVGGSRVGDGESLLFGRRRVCRTRALSTVHGPLPPGSLWLALSGACK